MAKMKLIPDEKPENNRRYLQSVLELTDQLLFEMEQKTDKKGQMSTSQVIELYYHLVCDV
jgi:hypothetical protein